MGPQSSKAWADITGKPASFPASAHTHGLGDLPVELVVTSDARLSDARPPTGAAGNVLAGTYPNPGFAVPMATVADLEAGLANALAIGEAAISAALDGVGRPENLDVSANPLYPAAVAGDFYRFTTDGKIGGADGKSVSAFDAMLCVFANAGGTEAEVGNQWAHLQRNNPELTTVGNSISQIATPVGPRFLRINADGSVSLLNDADYKAALALAKADVGLSDADNTSDADKPVSTLQATALAGKAATSLVGSPFSFGFHASDLSTAITAGAGKYTFPMPFAANLTAVRGDLLTAVQTGGSAFTVDINAAGASILGDKLTIDNGEANSTTAATPATITTAALAAGALISIDQDQIGDGTAKGLFITFSGTYA